MNILTTIETDFQKVEAAVISAVNSLGAEAKIILSSVGTSAWAQAIALFKESHIGASILNSVSAVQASGGNMATALPIVIANTGAAIAALDKSGNVLTGLEADVQTFATALVSAVIGDFKADAVAGPLISLVSSII